MAAMTKSSSSLPSGESQRLEDYNPVKTEGIEPFINHVAGDNKKGNGKWKGKYFTLNVKIVLIHLTS